VIYLPLGRIAKLLKDSGREISNFPLHHYAEMPFIMLQNDALDRFGTRLEKRFSKQEISNMLKNSGFDLSTLVFSNNEPYWTFSIIKY
jgi:hypothetical protein